jgi:hypothetical protein
MESPWHREKHAHLQHSVWYTHSMLITKEENETLNAYVAKLSPLYISGIAFLQGGVNLELQGGNNRLHVLIHG